MALAKLVVVMRTLVTPRNIALGLAAAASALGFITAREYSKRVIKRKVAERLRPALISTLIQLSLFLGAYLLVRSTDGVVAARIAASVVLWGVTIYNMVAFFTQTLPGLREAYAEIRGLKGYVLRNILRVSIVNELVERNIVMLGCCVLLATVARWGLQSAFQYIEPWRQLFS